MRRTKLPKIWKRPFFQVNKPKLKSLPKTWAPLNGKLEVPLEKRLSRKAVPYVLSYGIGEQRTETATVNSLLSLMPAVKAALLQSGQFQPAELTHIGNLLDKMRENTIHRAKTMYSLPRHIAATEKAFVKVSPKTIEKIDSILHLGIIHFSNALIYKNRNSAVFSEALDFQIAHDLMYTLKELSQGIEEIRKVRK